MWTVYKVASNDKPEWEWMAVVHMQGKRIMPEEGKRQKQSEREREGERKKIEMRLEKELY